MPGDDQFESRPFREGDNDYGELPGTHSSDAATYEERKCRSCGDNIPDPFPNQFECSNCESLEREMGLDSPGIERTEDTKDEKGKLKIGSDSPNTSTKRSFQENLNSDLKTEVTESELPPLDMKPSDKSSILNRIDGAANEQKFRDLHLEANWRKYYSEEEYEDPYRSAVVGYLRIVAFYTRLSVLHVEAFYRSSALYDEDLWRGWDRAELLEKAVKSQADNDCGYRIYGSEDAFGERFDQANRRLRLVEKKIDR